MACACKAAKQSVKQAKTANKFNKRGLSFFLGMLRDGLLGIIEKIIVILLFIILVPVIIGMLIISYLFTGQLRVIVPQKILNALKRVERNEQELTNSYQHS